jgi:hypothetical protein
MSTDLMRHKKKRRLVAASDEQKAFMAGPGPSGPARPSARKQGAARAESLGGDDTEAASAGLGRGSATRADTANRPRPARREAEGGYAQCAWQVLRSISAGSRSRAGSRERSRRCPSEDDDLSTAGGGRRRRSGAAGDVRDAELHAWGGQAEHGAGGSRKGAATHNLRRRSAPLFHTVFLLWLIGLRETASWIALSKDGYVVTRGLGLQ